MKWLLLLMITSLMKTSLGQGNQLFHSTEEVADYMVNKYQKEDDKIKAVYNWVISNFRYDADNTFAVNAGPDPSAKITVAFKRRKGVCDNISAIFNDICIKSGITSVVISGYTKQNNVVDRSGHSWTAAFINNQWFLFDPTWDLGNSINPYYFMSLPKDFISSHMPFDPLWQLLNYPIPHLQFYGRENEKNNAAYFNFVDSIYAFYSMDSLKKLKSVASRIERFGIYNERIKVNYQVIKMNIEIAHQEEEVELYNSAVENLNAVTNALNQFIEYRNNRFTPFKSDHDLKDLLNGIDDGINSALNKLNKIDISEAKLVMATESERKRITGLIQKIASQKSFLKKYLNTTAEERPLLFYEKK